MHGAQTLMASRRKHLPRNRAEPTPERMAKVGEAYEVGDHGTMTLRDAPLETLAHRRVISTGLYNAGVKHRLHWYRAGIAAKIGSMDMNRVFGGDIGPKFGVFGSEATLHHYEQYRLAIQELGKQLGPVVDNICCLEISVVDAGRKAGWKDEKQARAVATALLREGLDRLRVMWGMS